jgi:hypothetical protein
VLGWVRNLIGFYEARELDRGPAVQRGLQATAV